MFLAHLPHKNRILCLFHFCLGIGNVYGAILFMLALICAFWVMDGGDIFFYSFIILARGYNDDCFIIQTSIQNLKETMQ